MATSILLAGCIDDLEQPLITVFAAHHASPENGMFPDRGDDNRAREFVTNEGWDITLVDSFVTVVGVTLVACDGMLYPLKMYFGACPEDLRGRDLARTTVAGQKIPPGDYCELDVEYGPYPWPVEGEVDGADAPPRHDIPSNENVGGATIYLRGGAARADGELVEFDLRFTETVHAPLDLRDPETGAPMRVRADEQYPEELTVSKTYDRFFDDIDFDDFDDFDNDSLAATLGEILVAQTRVTRGERIDPSLFE